MKSHKTLIYAHRGASGLVAHENTIEAFAKAIEVGADGIELDVRKTKDNIIIVNHNPDIEGLLIRDHTYEQLCEATKKSGYIMPTLKEALEFCKNRIFLDIEIKEKGYEQEIIDQTILVLDYKDFAMRSFNKEAIYTIKKLNDNIHTILLLGGEVKYGIFSRALEVFPSYYLRKTKCDGVSPHYKLMILGYISRMRFSKTPISVWTVNDAKVMKKLIKKRVDIIITNYPDLAIKIRNIYQ